ncbi:MAG: hypothetical protein KDJ65_29715 [Anaerolineae bacterium]|nr:hypothetical protein [Anaerolineae bacterium]
METIEVTIPVDWLAGQSLSPDQLREALKLGLAELQQRQSDQRSHRQQVEQALIAVGLSHAQADKPPLPAPSLSPERQQHLAERFATGGPLSDVIIEERSDRV